MALAGNCFSEANKTLRLQRHKKKEVKQCQVCHLRKTVKGKATRPPGTVACQLLELRGLTGHSDAEKTKLQTTAHETGCTFQTQITLSDKLLCC